MASPAVAGTANVNSVGTASSSYVANAPASIATGELLICSVLVRSAGASNTVTRPTGWTIIDEYISAGNAGMILSYWKLATGSEPASYTFTGTVSAVYIATAFRVTGADTTTPVNGTPQHASDAGPTVHTIPAVTTTVADTMLVAIEGSVANVSLASTWGTMTQVWFSATGTGTSARSQGGATEPIAATGSTGTRSVTNSTSGTVGLQSFAIAPAAVTPASDVYYTPPRYAVDFY